MAAKKSWEELKDTETTFQFVLDFIDCLRSVPSLHNVDKLVLQIGLRNVLTFLSSFTTNILFFLLAVGLRSIKAGKVTRTLG